MQTSKFLKKIGKNLSIIEIFPSIQARWHSIACFELGTRPKDVSTVPKSLPSFDESASEFVDARFRQAFFDRCVCLQQGLFEATYVNWVLKEKFGALFGFINIWVANNQALLSSWGSFADVLYYIWAIANKNPLPVFLDIKFVFFLFWNDYADDITKISRWPMFCFSPV